MENRILDSNLNYDGHGLSKGEIKNINLTKLDVNEASSNIIKARNGLLFLIVLQGVGVVIGLVNNPYDVPAAGVIAEGVIFGGGYALCAYFIKKNPMYAVVTALLIYLSIIILSEIGVPGSWYQGYLWKIAVLSFFGWSIHFAARHKQGLKKLQSLGRSPHEIELGKNLKYIPRTQYEEQP